MRKAILIATSGLLLLAALVACKPADIESAQAGGDENESPGRIALRRDFLLGHEAMPTPVSTDAYLPRLSASPSNRFEGRLTLQPAESAGQIEYLTDLFAQASQAHLQLAALPPFSFDFVQDGDVLIPVQRGRQRSGHPYWEFVLESGKVWDESGDLGWSRAALPFALAQRNANCTHNGLLTFLFKTDGTVSRVAYQVGSETCYYFQANLWGVVQAEFTPGELEQAQIVRDAYHAEIASRLPVKPMAALAGDDPGVELAHFALHDPGELSTYGFVFNGVHYSGGCPTRFGPYPFCDVIDLPSYSLAKTIVAGSIFMQLEAMFPGARNLLVKDYVPECREASVGDNRWDGVTLGHLLDMSSGNYASAVDQEDEFASYEGPFFGEDTHAARISEACSLFPRRAEPGSAWVYHTTDTYIAGTLMTAYLREQRGTDQDVFDDLLVANILGPLHFSQTMQHTLRSYDEAAQPLAGFGLILQPDDIARFAAFLSISDGRVNGLQVLNRAELDAALQKVVSDPGLAAGNWRYNNAMWAGTVLPRDVCNNPVWVPFMSGYGGISVALMPNDSIYYVFSDGAHFKWSEAAIESNRLKPFCENADHDL